MHRFGIVEEPLLYEREIRQVRHKQYTIYYVVDDANKKVRVIRVKHALQDLNKLDISKWNTSKVENMSLMFFGCENLMSLSIDKWDIRKVSDMSGMFDDCPAPRPSWYHE